jgi:hypothetical protein
VVSCSDVLINKARIAIQIPPSERQSAFIRYGNCRFDFNRPDVCPSWSVRVHSRYGNCVLKNFRLDVHPLWSKRVKPYMEITCSGRATVRTSVSHRQDAALKHERFSANFSENPVALMPVWLASVHITAVAHFAHQPINRSPWALRTARILY